MHKVRLISITQPLIPEASNANELIAYCARVSSPQNQDKHDTAPKLLRYCLRKKHFSIFEQAHVGAEIVTTRDIGRQILRHKSFSFQEFSQRYAEVTDSPEWRECRVQDEKNRQSSHKTQDKTLCEWWRIRQQTQWASAITSYELAIKNGIAKEQARALLPEGLTPSRMYMTGSLRSWIHYISVRCGVETQAEHRWIAKDIARLLAEKFEFLGDLVAPMLEDEYSAEG